MADARSQDAERWLADFGQSVRRHRVALELSQAELAERAGLHPTYVSGIERGRRNPSLKIVHSLAKALDIDVAHLFTGGH